MTTPDKSEAHVTVLLEESVYILRPEEGEVFVDATLGLGGHTELIARRNSAARIIGIDQDAKAIEMAKDRLGEAARNVFFVHANFADISRCVAEAGFKIVHGVIADLGVSSMQVDSPERGFSFRYDAPLDMRMDPDSGGETAAEMLERLSEEEIANLIYEYGEERASRKIARRIVSARRAGNPVATTTDLRKLIESCVRSNPRSNIHPATRTFQALRIAVNQELGILEDFLKDAVSLLSSGGRLVVISFHSLEDRIVKRTFLRLSGKCECPPRMPECVCGATKEGMVLTKKPIIPSDEEINRNPRARSSKLRAFEKI